MTSERSTLGSTQRHEPARGDRAAPAGTKLLICVWHRFTLWRPPADVAARVRRRWPGVNVVHLPTYEHMEDEIGDTDIFVGDSLRPGQFTPARRLKWLPSTPAGVRAVVVPEAAAAQWGGA